VLCWCCVPRRETETAFGLAPKVVYDIGRTELDAEAFERYIEVCVFVYVCGKLMAMVMWCCCFMMLALCGRLRAWEGGCMGVRLVPLVSKS
jgi:hypothetical protein